MMEHGYANRILRVNLTDKTIKKEVLTREYLHKWIGGTGLGIKIIYDEVDPSLDWSDAGNKVVFATGPLAGTYVKGSGTYSVVTKGAMTNGLATSQANGYFGAFLKFANYAGIIIEGQADDWIYLYIDGENVELKSASSLVGLDTVETQDALHKEYNLSRATLSVSCIGPAGEHLVRFACITSDYGHVAAHNGIGSCLGKKKIKAIAIKKPPVKINVFDQEGLKATAKKIGAAALNSPTGPDTYLYGTNSGHVPLEKMGLLPVRNLTTSIFPECVNFSGKSLRERFEYKRTPCWRCDWNHCGSLKITSGPNAGFETDEPEYEAMAAMGPLIGIKDPEKSLVLADRIDRLGMDCNESGWVMAWVIECFENGLFTREQLDGLEMTWGCFESVYDLLGNIAYRRGFGDTLAEGVKRAAEHIGGEARDCAVYTGKGNTPRSHDHRADWKEYLDTIVSSTGTIETTGGSINIKQHGGEPVINPQSWEQIAQHNATVSGRRVFEDSLGICRIVAAEDITLTSQALTQATGDAWSVADIMKTGKRFVNLMRVYNLRCGITADCEIPSKRYRATPMDGPLKGVNVEGNFYKLKERFFELMGWDKKTGQPLPQTLKNYDLAHIIEDLE